MTTLETHARFGIDGEPEASVLVLSWDDSDGEMTNDEFKLGLERLAAHAEEHRPAALMIDARRFGFRPGDGVMEWRAEAIVPRYNDAGVRRFAFVAPQTPPGAAPTRYPGEDFETVWFTSEEEARAWIAG